MSRMPWASGFPLVQKSPAAPSFPAFWKAQMMETPAQRILTSDLGFLAYAIGN